MLEIAVFLCGAVVMVIELTGSRVLAPYLGTSLVVWTSLIGIILGSLSIGYWWGGRLADRRPEARLLGGIILISAFATAFMALIKTVVLGFIQARSGGLHTAAMSATLLLFAPPSILIGMVSPFAVRLKLEDTRTAVERPENSMLFPPSEAYRVRSWPVSRSSRDWEAQTSSC